MPETELMEVLFARELRGLCANCAHADGCTYRINSRKIVIQCELYEVDVQQAAIETLEKGLCANCDLAATCRLPGRRTGVWHCEEYK